jgi:hypothetical protein
VSGPSPKLRWVSSACWPRRRCAPVAEQGEARLERPIEAAAEQLAEADSAGGRIGQVGCQPAVWPQLDAFYTLMSTWESLGILLCRGEVSLDLVDDFFSGPIMLSWQLFQGYVMDVRRRTGRETFYEWFQWLAERMEEREAAQPPIPAYVEYRNWKPR